MTTDPAILAAPMLVPYIKHTLANGPDYECWEVWLNIPHANGDDYSVYVCAIAPTEELALAYLAKCGKCQEADRAASVPEQTSEPHPVPMPPGYIETEPQTLYDLAYELEGVIMDVEQAATGFDAVCLGTVKRVRDALREIAASSAPTKGEIEAQARKEALDRKSLREPFNQWVANSDLEGEDSEEELLFHAFVAGAQISIEEAISLCRDYSSRAGNVYIKDVESALRTLAQGDGE